MQTDTLEAHVKSGIDKAIYVWETTTSCFHGELSKFCHATDTRYDEDSPLV